MICEAKILFFNIKNPSISINRFIETQGSISLTRYHSNSWKTCTYYFSHDNGWVPRIPTQNLISSVPYSKASSTFFPLCLTPTDSSLFSFKSLLFLFFVFLFISSFIILCNCNIIITWCQDFNFENDKKTTRTYLNHIG